MSDREQLDRVRQRFTRTAEQFAKFSLSSRSAEAETLVELAAPRGDELALDMACGPGTFTRAFAPRVRRICGLDLTPALLAQAQEASAKAGLVSPFVCGQGEALPFAGGTFTLVCCGFSFHHFADPAPALREMCRVLRSGGKLAVVDLIVPGEFDAARSRTNNAIEIARDASHVHSMCAAELRSVVESAGFRRATEKITERVRSFDDWMQIAGWSRSDPAYGETRRLMAAAIENDAAGFHARSMPGSTLAPPDIEFVQTSFFLMANKPA